jgi:hypothetical protein
MGTQTNQPENATFFFVDQYKIGPDMAVSKAIPLTSQGVIAVSRLQWSVFGKRLDN